MQSGYPYTHKIIRKIKGIMDAMVKFPLACAVALQHTTTCAVIELEL